MPELREVATEGVLSITGEHAGADRLIAENIADAVLAALSDAGIALCERKPNAKLKDLADVRMEHDYLWHFTAFVPIVSGDTEATT